MVDILDGLKLGNQLGESLLEEENIDFRTFYYYIPADTTWHRIGIRDIRTVRHIQKKGYIIAKDTINNENIFFDFNIFAFFNIL